MPHAAAPRRRKLVSLLGDCCLPHFQKMWNFLCLPWWRVGIWEGLVFLKLEVWPHLGFPSNHYKRWLCSRRVKGHSHRNALALLPHGGWQPGEAETS